MTGQLDGKVAVVLGAAGQGNMGQVIARTFAREGAKLIVAGRVLDAARARTSLTLRSGWLRTIVSCRARCCR